MPILLEARPHGILGYPSNFRLAEALVDEIFDDRLGRSRLQVTPGDESCRSLEFGFGRLGYLWRMVWETRSAGRERALEGLLLSVGHGLVRIGRVGDGAKRRSQALPPGIVKR
jgi:hypothetical protein